MTGIESNLEALAEKEYRQDETWLRTYEKAIEYWNEERKRAESEIQAYTDKILEIQKKRKGSHER